MVYLNQKIFSLKQKSLNFPKKIKANSYELEALIVLEAGLEPARPKEHRILSPACLPIPPFEHSIYRTDKSGI